MAYLHLKDRDEAEDVTQETFIRAYRKLDQFDTERPLRPWLLSICANLARNRKRSLSRYWRALQRLAGSDPEARQGSGGVPRREAGDASEELWHLLQAMKGQDREVIYCRYFLDLSVAESAQVLGVPEGTVKSRVYRALERLREAIEREAPHLAHEVMMDEG